VWAIIYISGAEQAKHRFARKRENMWKIKDEPRRLELRGKMLCLIVLLALTGEACLIYAARMVLSEL
jgi:hypothetical protein